MRGWISTAPLSRDPKKATPEELKGEKVFNGPGRCAECHPAPYFTDNTMHDLHTERFFKPHMYNGRMASGDGKIKTFPLRGIKDSPPYLHDGRAPTLHDAIEKHRGASGRVRANYLRMKKNEQAPEGRQRFASGCESPRADVIQLP